MGINASTGIGIGVALGAGVGSALLMRPLVAKWGAHDWTKAYAEHDDFLKDADAARQGGSFAQWPGTSDTSNAEEFAPTVLAPVFAIMGGVGAGIGGISLLGRAAPKTGLGIGAVALGGALLGGAVGGIMGFAKGGHQVDAQHTVDVAAQSKAAFEGFDRNGDGAITLARGTKGNLSEELRYSGDDATGAPTYDSAHDGLAAADADANGVVTPDELTAHIAAYDKNGDGKITRTEPRDKHGESPYDVLLDHLAPLPAS
jgi:hypothetical protein